MTPRRAFALACWTLTSGCAVVGSYDFDGYSAAAAVDAAGAAGAPSAGGGGASQGGKAAGAAGAVNGGSAQGGDSGQGGLSQGGGGQAGQGGGAGQAGGGQSGAGQGGVSQGGTSQGGASQGGTSQGGTSQGGTSQGGAGQGGAGQGGANQGGATQGGAGQGGASQGGAGQGGGGGCSQPQTWYRDTDFDGHGTALLSSVVACAKPADEPNVVQWVLSSDDCNDGNNDVFPGQKTFFSTPFAKLGAPGDVSFDFDCDGAETPTAPTYAPNCGGLGSACSGTGYIPFTPARKGGGANEYCGSTETISCKWVLPLVCGDGAKTSASPLACK